MAALTLFEKLDHIESRYQELTAQLSSPEVLNDSSRYRKLARTHANLAEVVEKYREWKTVEKGLHGVEQMLMESEDAEMKRLAHEEERQLLERKNVVESDLKRLLCLEIQTTRRTSFWKSVPVPAGMRPLFSPRNSFACTRAMRNRRDGVSRCWKAPLFSRGDEGYCRGHSGRQGLFQAQI